MSTLPNRASLEKMERQAEFIATIGTSENAAGQTVAEATNPDTGVTLPTMEGVAEVFETIANDATDAFDAQFLQQETDFNTQTAQFDATVTAQYIYARVDDWSAIVGQSVPEADKLNSWWFVSPVSMSGGWYGPKQSQTFPIIAPVNPAVDDEWALVSSVTDRHAVAVSVNEEDHNVMYSTETTTPITNMIRANDQQKTYISPPSAIAKFIKSVVGNQLTTDDDEVYTLQPYGVAAVRLLANHGVVANDGTDQTDNINNALVPGINFLPAGTYVVLGNIHIKSNVRLFGEGQSWGSSAGVTILEYQGELGGNVVRMATNPIGTECPVATEGASLENILIRGNNLANVGLYGNYLNNGCSIKNVFARSCNHFGILLGKMWYVQISKLTVRNGLGIGIGIGVQYMDSYDDRSVNGVVFNDIRASDVGEKYDAATAPYGFDYELNPKGGCGILIESKTSTIYKGINAESCYGPGVVLAPISYSDGTMEGVYIEANMKTAVADGAAPLSFGMLIINDNNTTSTFSIKGLFGNQDYRNDRVRYITTGGSMKYTIDTARTLDISSDESVVPIKTKNIGILTNNTKINLGGQSRTVNLSETGNSYNSYNTTKRQTSLLPITRYWAEGQKLVVGRFLVKSIQQGSSVSAIVNVDVTLNASTGLGGTSDHWTAKYIACVNANHRFASSLSIGYTLDLVSENRFKNGVNLFGDPNPELQVEFDDSNPLSQIGVVYLIAPTGGELRYNSIAAVFSVTGMGFDSGGRAATAASVTSTEVVSESTRCGVYPDTSSSDRISLSSLSDEPYYSAAKYVVIDEINYEVESVDTGSGFIYLTQVVNMQASPNWTADNYANGRRYYNYTGTTPIYLIYEG